MSTGNATKRQRRSQPDASDNAVVDMEALFEQKLSEMEQKMQSKIDDLQVEVDAMKDKCGSLERSLEVLANNWEYTAPPVPHSYWHDRGHHWNYAESMDVLLYSIKDVLNDLRRAQSARSGEYTRFILGCRHEETMIHDEILMPHWKNLVDALNLYCHKAIRYNFEIANVHVPEEVLTLLTPTLKSLKKMNILELNNAFDDSHDGVKFAVELAQGHPELESFRWMNTQIDRMEDANRLVEAINGHPSISELLLENCCGANIDGYNLLCSLLGGKKDYYSIDLDNNAIRTMGRTFLSDYISSNPKLEELRLDHNNLDDEDAMLIAEALKHNTNLRELHLHGNDVTRVGGKVLQKALLDTTSLNTASSSNHCCAIYCSPALKLDQLNRDDPLLNRIDKVYNLLTSRNRTGTNVYHLDLEFQDEYLSFAPNVLGSVYNYCEVHDGNSLSICYEILRSWRMPSIYNVHRRSAAG